MGRDRREKGVWEKKGWSGTRMQQGDWVCFIVPETLQEVSADLLWMKIDEFIMIGKTIFKHYGMLVIKY